MRAMLILAALAMTGCADDSCDFFYQDGYAQGAWNAGACLEDYEGDVLCETTWPTVDCHECWWDGWDDGYRDYAISYCD